MFKVEKRILDFCKKHYLLLFGIIITILALGIRICMLDYQSYDYVNFLSEWFDYLKEHGGLHALRSYPGDYNAPYVTIMALLTYIPIKKIILIKSVSILFDFALALSSSYFVYKLVKKNKQFYSVLTYAVLLFLPNMLMNSALWWQCDSLYTTFVLWSLIFLLDKKYIWSFVMLGVAFAFKLQFVFILPLYIIYYVMEEKFSILHFFLIPFVNFVMCIPCMIFGKPIRDCFLIYFNQTATYKDSLVLNFPNIYNFISKSKNVSLFYSIGEVVTIVVLALLLLYFIKNKIKFNSEKILLLGIYSIVITTFLLPGMHERYLFVGEILSVLYFIIYRRNLLLAVFINFVALITYSNFLNSLSFPYMQLLSICYLVVIILFTRYLFSVLEDKKAKE